jgi:endonuclease/exonuclease/phosphatase family metal-dependent hydrolase
MKKLSVIDKIIFFINSIIALFLILALIGQFVSPNNLPLISFLGLTAPILILLNLIFAIYWAVKFKKQFLLPVVTLIICYSFISKFYNFKEKKILLSSDIKIMSYNVRMFNLYNWIEEDNIDQRIYEFIIKKDPDILCLQEFHSSAKIGFKYPYKYVKTSEFKNHFAHAIFSKFPIINTGSMNFSNSSNNAIFVDILKDKDTVRVYNIHLESLKINPKEEELTQANSEKLRLRVQNAFKKQANQATLISNHIKAAKHKSIICGDFNNTAFSWVYQKLKGDKKDAFEVAGKGFGKTYDFKFPLRIDFILTDESIELNNFKTFEEKYSDHFPIMARINFNNNSTVN